MSRPWNNTLCIRGIVLLISLPFEVINASSASDTPLLDTSEVVVTARAENESLTSPSVDEARKQQTVVPGGFTLQDTDEMEHGRASNFEDLLQRVPGVFLQSDNGAEVTKASIRGSGILSEDEPLGVQFLLDGLTLNQGDGEANLEDFDLATVKYVEVFRGSDALRYGSITLGGAINLVTITGYEADHFRMRLEGGSFGYFRGQITSGGFSGPVDYVASLMGRHRDGFRDHNEETAERFFADLGDRLSDHLENRFYLTIDRVDRQLPGGLTKNEMNEDPQQANAQAVTEDFNKKWGLIRLADKISFRDTDHELDAGLFWAHRNLEQRGLFEQDFREGISAFYSDNYGANFSFTTHDEVFGRRNTLTVGFSPQLEKQVTQNFENLSGHRGLTTALDTEISVNAPFYIEDQHYLAEKLSLLLGMQAIYARRRFDDHFRSDAEGDQSHEQKFYGWNPKTGLIYEFDKESQLFASFSGSWQPPSFDNMVEFVEGPNSSVVYTPLHPQRARTLELGTRGKHGRLEWDLSLYHTWLRNELLALNDAQGNDIGAVNVERSYHQGIEAGLEIKLLNSVFQPNDQLMLNQIYTLNDFHFDDDPVYRSNRIAGIPMHLYEAELLYTTSIGFYIGPNLQWNLSRYPVDQANSLFANSYALIGFKVGYRPTKGLSLFVEAKNLTDQHFASAVDPIADARTAEGATIFHPGDGRSLYGGVSWSW